MADPARHEWSADDLAGLSEAADVVSARIQARLAEGEVARVQRLVASHNQVHDMIARAVPLHEVLTTACEAIERYDPSLMVSVLQRDPETNALHSGVGPSFPQTYFDAVEGTPIGPSMGTCGPAACCSTAVSCPPDGEPSWSQSNTGVRIVTLTPLRPVAAGGAPKGSRAPPGARSCAGAATV